MPHSKFISKLLKKYELYLNVILIDKHVQYIYIAGIIQTNIVIKQISKRLKLKKFFFFAITCYFDR